MSDNISRADAIDALCHNCAYYTDAQCKTDSGYWCESGAMIREDIPSAEAEWIPCSERLPEEGRYFVTTTLSVFSPQILNYDADGGEWFYDSCKSMDLDIPCVTAWMPLPEPYREDGEE